MSSSRRGRIQSDLFTPTSSKYSRSSGSEGSGSAESTSTEGSRSTRVIRISLSSVREKLRRLAEVGDIRVSDLSTGLLSDFTDMKEVAEVSSNAGNSQIVLRLIEEYFSGFNRNNIQPGTVASHFRGCTAGDNFGGDPSCSAVCGGSFQPTMVSGWQTCAENVAHLRDGQINFVHLAQGSERATLHIFDQNWKFLTPLQLDDFKRRGISKVALYRYGSGDYSVRHEHLPLELLPAYQSTEAQNLKPQSHNPQSRTSNAGAQASGAGNPGVRATSTVNKKKTSAEEGSGWIFWLVIGLAVALVLAGIYYKFRYSKD